MPTFGSFRAVHSLLPFDELRLLPPPLREGLTHGTQLRFFPSALRLLPASETKKGGRTEMRLVRRRDTEKGRGPGSLHLALRVGRAEEKKGRSRGGPKKVARDKSSQPGEGCARPLRRLPARLCAPARSGRGGGRDGLLRLRRGRSEARFLTVREASGFQRPQHACARLSLTPGKVLNSRPLSTAAFSWLL